MTSTSSTAEPDWDIESTGELPDEAISALAALLVDVAGEEVKPDKQKLET